MISITRGRLAVVVALSLVVGWAANDLMSSAHPQRKRPILTFIKNWWWVPLLLDTPQRPEGSTYHDSCHEAEQPIGSDGYRLVHHGRAL